MQNVDALVYRIAQTNAGLAADIGQILRLGLRPKQQKMDDRLIIEAAKRAVSYWLSPTYGQIVRGNVAPKGEWRYIWHVARPGEGGSILLNPGELYHVIHEDEFMRPAIMESQLPDDMHTAFQAFIFRAELDSDSWRMLFHMIARGALPLVLSTTDRRFDTVNILVAP